MTGLAFHHHGLAVRADGEAIAFLEHLGYRIGALVEDPRQNVRLRLCRHAAMPSVEIVMPGRGPGPLAALLKRHDQLLYHTCYETDDRGSALAGFEERGMRVIEVLPPTPAALFGGRMVSFHTIMGFGLIELLDRS